MSFLSTAFLLALPLIAAPLLLHLFDRRRNVAIQWGAMQFLVAATARKTSARRLKQWLLLLLRTLAVALLVFALARPLVPAGWIGGQERSETIFVVDNSMSMMRNNDDGTMMEQAIDRAISEVAELSPGDHVRLLTAAPYPVWGPPQRRGRDPGLHEGFASQVQHVKATLGRSDLLAALLTAVQAEPEPTVKQRRVVVLSDGQSADWSLHDETGWSRFRETLEKSAIPTELEFVQLENPGPSKGNLAVDRVTANRTLVGIDQPVILTAQIHNHSTGRFPSRPMTWQIDAAEIYDDHVGEIEGDKIEEINWTHSFSAAGAYRVTCRIENADDLLADNKASVIVEVVDQVPVLVVEGASDLAEMQQDSFFVQAALGWIGGESLEGKSVYAPTSVSPERIAGIDLHQYRAVVIPNLNELAPDAVEPLRDFVSSGGGVWVGLGARTEIDAFNQQWFAGGNGLSPLALDRIVDDVHSNNGPLEQSTSSETTIPRPRTTINPFGKDHAATTQLADNEQLDIGDVVVKRRFQFVTPEQENEASLLLGLSNGQPLVVEKLFGRGRVIVQAIPLRMQWSNLARSQAFVVMVRDWIDYLSQPRATKFNLQPGDPIVFRSSKMQTIAGTLTTPQGHSVELTADRFGDESIFRTNRTILPGDYALEIGIAGEQVPFYVSRDVRESNLSSLPQTDQKQLATLAELRTTATGAGLASSKGSDPLWPHLLIGLIGLVTCELLLSGMLARERFGSSGIAETSEQLSSDINLKNSATAGAVEPFRTRHTIHRLQKTPEAHEPLTTERRAAQ